MVGCGCTMYDAELLLPAFGLTAIAVCGLTAYAMTTKHYRVGLPLAFILLGLILIPLSIASIFSKTLRYSWLMCALFTLVAAFYIIFDV